MAFKPILATKANVNVIDEAINAAFIKSGKRYEKQFNETTATWKRDVKFTIKLLSGTNKGVEVYTNDEIYGYVNFGTKPHKITSAKGLSFNTPSSPKTKPRVIKSTRGSRGKNKVYTRVVNHPGTKAREFDITIRDDEINPTVKDVKEAYDIGIKKTGHNI